MITLETSMGNIKIKLFTEEAPISSENFTKYVKDGFYDGLTFHRVINGFMIQGGGLNENMEGKQGHAPIKNEANNGLKNTAGTLAMARTSDPHSASSQFFINVADNTFLNHTEESMQGWGYAVFGEVIEGMDIVDQIKAVSTTSKAGHQDVPVEPIFIKRAFINEE